MAKVTPTPRLPWQDRWTIPTLKQLVEPLSPHHRKAFETLRDELEGFADVQCRTNWYGPSWNWTLEYTTSSRGGDPDCLAYLVPKTTGPVICVTLVDELIEDLPIRRLNRYIREGIKSAKCAISSHWAIWNPNNQVEVSHIIDLIQRKYRWMKEA